MLYVSYDAETGDVTGVYEAASEAESPYIEVGDNEIDPEDYDGYTVDDGVLVAPDDESITMEGVDAQNQNSIVQFTILQNSWVNRATDDGNIMAYDMAMSGVASNTVFYILSVNRGLLHTDIEWSCDEDLITFQTEQTPMGDLEVIAVLSSSANGTGTGRIEAWPQGEWKTVRYRHSLHLPDKADWPLTLSPGISVTIELSQVFFSRAQVFFVSPIWTGNDMVMIPHTYVNASYHLCVTLSNVGSTVAQIKDILLRIVYTGELDGFVEEDADQASAST